MRYALAGFAGLLMLFALGWLCGANDYFYRKVFDPKNEATRRETFEQSKAYVQGSVQELENMQFEYLGATPNHRAALAGIILHRAADFDEARLPEGLRQFIAQLRAEASDRAVRIQHAARPFDVEHAGPPNAGPNAGDVP